MKATTLNEILNGKDVQVAGVKPNKRTPLCQRAGFAIPLDLLDDVLRKIKADDRVEVVQKIAFGEFALIELLSRKTVGVFNLDAFVRELDEGKARERDALDVLEDIVDAWEKGQALDPLMMIYARSLIDGA